MEHIYVVLEKSHTVLGRLARLLDPYEYTHITVCLDDEFRYFYSFSRFRHYGPFCSGFMRETMDCYAYGDYNDVKLKVFEVPVTKENKERIKRFIATVYRDRKNYYFNLYSALTMNLFHGFRIYKAYNCMSFVGKILEMTEAVYMEREYYKYTIEELEELMAPYEKEEKYFSPERIENVHYMDHVGLLYNIGSFIKLNGTLITRLLTKKPYEEEF